MSKKREQEPIKTIREVANSPNKPKKNTEKRSKSPKKESKALSKSTRRSVDDDENTNTKAKASRTIQGKSTRERKVEATTIKAVLETAQAHSPVYDFLIHQAERLRGVLDKLSKDMEVLPPVFEEVSREGEVRRRTEPTYTIYLDYSKEYRQVLDALKMTARSAGIAENDGIDELSNAVSKQKVETL